MTNLPYRIVIGLEVHVQLLTRTKLFCGCSTEFGLPPNTATCPICIGMPGVLPVMNRRAFDLSLRAALALNCQITPFTKWDRKNYYYPDLPKNFQISQYDLPFSHDGYLDIETSTGPKRIGIIRAHLEEDAGKMLHDESGGGKDSLVDLNRAGTPLLEIVSQPDITTPEEAKAYVEEIRLLLREIGVSDCEMQEGSLRCDANISVHTPRDDANWVYTSIVEIKNLNSISAVGQALEYKAGRLFSEYLTASGKTLAEIPRISGPATNEDILRRTSAFSGAHPKVTAGWDEARGVTKVQRRKELASDYRYFPEPDLAPIVVDAAWLERVRTEMGELPSALRVRLVQQYGLSTYDSAVLTRKGRAFTAYFEEVAGRCSDAKTACNWVTNQVSATLNEKKQDIGGFPISAASLAELIGEVKGGLNSQPAREVYALMLESGISPKEAIKQLGFAVVSDTTTLVEIVRRAIAANPKAVADFKKGKPTAANAIKGAVMRETKGMAKPDVVQQILIEELQKA